jgi:cellulose synthase/poly-beta-1,6-N-acetylglucosamine synthase-like glycosyltransferase
MVLYTLATSALALTLPGSAYLTILSAAAALPRRPIDPGNVATHARIVVLVPAHNESAGLLRTLQSLRREVDGDPLARIVVVADNCSDDTAAVARAAGVAVLERNDPDHRGKGHALNFGFDTCGDADWFIVVDADTDVAPGFLPAMRRAMTGTYALQCRYGVRDPLSSRRATLADVALGGWNVVRPRGRAALGWSAGILGNGFALSRQTLQRVPYAARSIIEDVEYHQLLVQSGLRVQWVDDTTVRGDMPDGAAAVQQRARWEGGRLRLIADRVPDMLGQMLRGQWRLIDPLLDLALLPLSWHVTLLLAALLLGSGTVQSLAVASLGVVAFHVALALGLIRANAAHARALLGVPAYLLWKLCLLPATWRAADRQAAWVRTARPPTSTAK